MRKGGRSKNLVLAALAAGALLGGGGCSKLQSSLNKNETLTLGDLQAQVETLRQQVAELQVAAGQSRVVEPVDVPAAVERTGDLTDQNRRSSPGRADLSASNRFAKGARATVTASILNVRETAGADAGKVGTLKKGALVEVIAVDGEWAKIHFSDSRNDVTGWVSTNYLQREE